MGKKRGSITVEAAIVLPFYILLLTFLANFLNIYYVHQVIQHGLNSAGSTLAQYCYAIDLTLGMDQLTLQEETSAKAQELGEAVNQFYTTAGNTLSSFNSGISLDTLPGLMKTAKASSAPLQSGGSKFGGLPGMMWPIWSSPAWWRPAEECWWKRWWMTIWIR